ncbi:MAG: hypothetical protein HC887_11005, partial [Desulfobacteraceae bacterium]|nr:hypothetical protein [Desulfobacteraceae bacterium]
MLQVGSLNMNSGSSITSDSPLANAYTDFATIRDRDDRTLIAGDRIVISNVYNGKSSDTIYTGKTYEPCKTYYVRNISELNRLPDQNLIVLGDIAEVGDAGDGKSGHFIYTDPSMGGWVRFDENKISDIADQSGLSKINYQLYSDIRQAPYAAGDMIRITDMGNGKSGLY